MAQSIQVAGDTQANWNAWNGIPNLREIIYETDTHLWKVGDGTTNYVSLPYVAANVATANTFNTSPLRDASTGGFSMGALTATTVSVSDGVLNRFIPNIRTVATGATTDTLLASDNGGIILYQNSAALVLTLPNNLVKGFNCTIYQRGGTVTWSAASGATVLCAQGFTKTAANGAAINFFVESNSGTNASYLASGYGA